MRIALLGGGRMGEALVAGLLDAGFDADDIDRVVWRNPVEFFAQSGRLILDDLGERDLAATFEGNTVLRGER